jgi:hypothetical protein
MYPKAPITVLDSPGIEDLLLKPGSFDLITYEVSPSIGSAAILDDIQRMHSLLTDAGCIHLIAHDRSYRDFLMGWKGPGRMTRIAGRDGLTVLQLTRRA